jgi:hypothetical protein
VLGLALEALGTCFLSFAQAAGGGGWWTAHHSFASSSIHSFKYLLSKSTVLGPGIQLGMWLCSQLRGGDKQQTQKPENEQNKVRRQKRVSSFFM